MSTANNVSTADKKVYTSAKPWQIWFYSCVPAVGNFFMIVFTLNAYIAKGGYGLATAVAASVVSAGKLFDAVTDPICAVICAKINSKKYGAVRPILALGLALLIFSVVGVMWLFPGKGLIPYTICYMSYVLGRTIHNQGKNIASNLITNNPKQRPLIGRYSQYYVMILTTMLSLWRAKVLFPKYGGMTFEMMQDIGLACVIVCTVMDILAFIALKDCDTYENVAAHHRPGVKVSLIDMFGMLKHNSAFLTGAIADATDKLANEVASAAVVSTLVFGILIGNYRFTGDISIYTTIATLITVTFITGRAKKIGAGKAYLQYTWIACGIAAAMFFFFLFCDYTQVSVSPVPTFIFIVLYSLLTASKATTQSCVTTMYQDIADYEFYLTGKYEPGLVVATITMLGKIVASVGGVLTAAMLATIGYVADVPQPGDPSNPKLFAVTMIMWLGMMIFGWVSSIIAMHWYPLSAEKMVEIQEANAKRKAENLAAQKH
ncbi:MAG: MFS transporter [Solobacterium sp.]|nr:MFS transporter [Solobacterium sp.]